jgi:hypothetical protein
MDLFMKPNYLDGIVFTTWCKCGGKVFANTKASLLSLWTESFIVVSLTGSFTELVTYSTIWMIGNRYLQHANNTMISAFIVERAVSVCSCDFQRIGTLLNVMTNLVQLFTHDGPTGFSCP